MEIAATARQHNIHVTVVDPMPVPFSRHLGPVVGQAVERMHRDRGVNFRLGVSIVEFGGSNGRVREVTLSDGSSCKADVVLVAIGSQPATDWLSGSGFDIEDGVCCDQYCSAAPGVFAAGDVARWLHVGYGRTVRVEHRMNATEQGVAVAANLLGARKPFVPVPLFWSHQYNVNIQAYGLLPPDPELHFETGSPTDQKFIATCHIDGRMVGAVGWNAVKDLRTFRERLSSEMRAVSGSLGL
jgi:NADPH-dependent 2,4-dienoyl-CoA reductase/sulfur reductase-like enzyme